MSRSRNWVGIAYPENLKDGWLEILNSKGVQALISPLHDSDVYERDIEKDGKIEHKKGDKKKPHYHVVFIFDSVKSEEQVNRLFAELHKEKPPICIQVLNLRGTIRYLIHKDDKNKAQYKEENIINIGGIDLDKYLKNDVEKDTDITNKFAKIIGMFDEYDIYTFSEACSMLYSIDDELFTLFRKNAYFFSQLIKDRYFNHKDRMTQEKIAKLNVNKI